jgi:mycothiol synthase
MNRKTQTSSPIALRPVTLADVEAVAALSATCSLDLLGIREDDATDWRSWWTTPGLCLERDTRVATSGDGQIVGYAEVADLSPLHVRPHAFGRVHPAWRGRGIGSILLEWQDARALEAVPLAPPNARVAIQQWSEGVDTAGRDLILSHGYHEVRRSWRMEIALAGEPEGPEWPDGVTVRSFSPERDLEPLVRAIREAFRDHWGYVENPFEKDIEITRHRMTEPSFNPRVWFLATDGEEIAGMALGRLENAEDPKLVWINTLGVRPAWRRRGIAHALLRHSFREFYRSGKRRVALGVDAASLTGATRVYERAGMRPVRTWVNFEKELRAGEELSTQSLSSSAG